MVKCVKDNQDFLKSVATASRYIRKNLIRKATPEQIKALSQISRNIAEEIVPLKAREVEKIVKGGYRKHIKETACRNKGVECKRRVFYQHGGFLQYIIPAALLYLKDYL